MDSFFISEGRMLPPSKANYKLKKKKKPSDSQTRYPERQILQPPVLRWTSLGQEQIQGSVFLLTLGSSDLSFLVES